MPRTGGRADHTIAASEVGTSQRVLDALRRLVRVLGASSRGVSPTGLNGAQLFVLRQLSTAPGLSIGALAARTLAGQSTVSEVVSRLVERGLVSRATSGSDARQAVLTLTADGKRAIAGVEPTAQERLALGLGALLAADRAALAHGLEAWLAAAGYSDVPATMFFTEDRAPRKRRAAQKATRRRTR